MELSIFCARMNSAIILLALCSPCKFIQSPMDFSPLNFFQATNKASLDFGRMLFNSPAAVLRPRDPTDISLLLSFISGSFYSRVTVAARGAGHSIHGQAQALDGIVIKMNSLPNNIGINSGKGEGNSAPYADVSGGALWIELLEESLKYGLAPRSWTDYLYLSIGGTLSNAGISGQTFKFGPQISNVLELDVVTGKGEMVTCSPKQSSELFNAVLGGLGQFGIITRARIVLQNAPQKVKWVRAFYDDFQTFTRDQVLLVLMSDSVDYVEGFIVLNEKFILSSSFAFPAQLGFLSEFHNHSSPKVYYCIEFAVHYYEPHDIDIDIEQVVVEISEKLSYMPLHIYSAEVPYFDFLNRVRTEEINLNKLGLWEVPHPWLNMFVPEYGINPFKDLLLETISPDEFEGPILIYPILRNKWSANTSVVLPDDETEPAGEVIYIVGMLRSANPATCSEECLLDHLALNRKIAESASGPDIGAKQYLPHHHSLDQWHSHFGRHWDRFVARKTQFDPLRILAPGQGIFSRISASAL